MSATKFISGVVLLVTACLLLSVTQARAETDKGRAVYHLIKAEESEVGDLPGHFLVLVEKKGLVFFENGEVVTGSGVETLDFTNGSGPYQGYSLFTFEDGSTQVVKFQGTSNVSKDGKIFLFEGTYSYVRGSDRFEGIQGDGSYTGKNFIAAGAGAYWDLTGTYTLPEK